LSFAIIIQVLRETFHISFVCFQLRVCEDTVCPLLSAGVMFQMPDIVKSCCTFLEHQLDPSQSRLIFATFCCHILWPHTFALDREC